MAMELNGNLPDYTAGKQNYSGYVSQGMEIGRAHV